MEWNSSAWNFIRVYDVSFSFGPLPKGEGRGKNRGQEGGNRQELNGAGRRKGAEVWQQLENLSHTGLPGFLIQIPGPVEDLGGDKGADVFGCYLEGGNPLPHTAYS